MTELPLYSKTSAPRFQAQFGGLPCDGAQGLCPELAGMLKGLFMLDPRRRWTARHGAASHYFGDLRGGLPLKPIAWAIPAGRGPFTWVQGRVDDKVKKWIQADPHWKVLVQQISTGACKSRGRCCTEMEQAFKHEEGSYADHDPPACTQCTNLDCSRPTPALRLAAFLRAFRRANLQWLVGLTARVRRALSTFPRAMLQANGEHVFNTCFSKTAFFVIVGYRS